MKQEEYISDEAVVKRVNEAVRIELEKRRQWRFRSSDMIAKRRLYIRKIVMVQESK